jgi:26S proteasome regulatory subunit N12
VSEVVSLFDSFKKSFDAGDAQLEAAQQQLGKLKIAMLGFSSLPPAAPSAPTESQQSELLLAREILEHGALLSVKAMDIPAFERYVAQLKIFYSDCAAALPASQRQYPILGLNLLRLLAQNRIAEFHTELELIPTELQHSNIYIKYPAQLEQHIMEGSYNKVLSAKQEGVFQKEGMYFMDMLVDTVREEIADCSEKAYATIKGARRRHRRCCRRYRAAHRCCHLRQWSFRRCSPGPARLASSCRRGGALPSLRRRGRVLAATDLQGLLMFASPQELADFAEQRGWSTDGSLVTFSKMEDEAPAQKLPSTQLIQDTLAYAKELERIV